jgi:hypothetical protein
VKCYAVAFTLLFESQYTYYICEHQFLNKELVESKLGNRLTNDHLQLELSVEFSNINVGICGIMKNKHDRCHISGEQFKTILYTVGPLNVTVNL